MALVVRRYADHPDFISEKAKCGGNDGRSVMIDDDMIGRLADLAIWAELTVNEIYS